MPRRILPWHPAVDRCWRSSMARHHPARSMRWFAEVRFPDGRQLAALRDTLAGVRRVRLVRLGRRPDADHVRRRDADLVAVRRQLRTHCIRVPARHGGNGEAGLVCAHEPEVSRSIRSCRFSRRSRDSSSRSAALRPGSASSRRPSFLGDYVVDKHVGHGLGFWFQGAKPMSQPVRTALPRRSRRLPLP